MARVINAEQRTYIAGCNEVSDALGIANSLANYDLSPGAYRKVLELCQTLERANRHFRDYDRQPKGAVRDPSIDPFDDGELSGCSCHISAPCAVCLGEEG